MAEVIGQNADGTYRVRTPAGLELDTAILPEGLNYTPPPQSRPGEGVSTRVETEAGAVADWLGTLGGGEAPAPAQPTMPNVAESLVDSILPPPPPKPDTGPLAGLPGYMREFGGYRGDPTNLQPKEDGTGWEMGTATHSESYEARRELGGNAPPVRQAPKALSLEDFVQPAQVQPPTSPNLSPGGAGGGMPTLDFRPTGPSRGQQELNEAFAMQREALAQRAALEQQRAAAEQARLDTELEAQRQRQQQEEQRQAFRQRAVEDAEGQLRDAVKALETPTGQLDPERWWNSRDTGQKVAAFASAFLTGFAGGPNVIQQMIERDIAAQRFNLERGDRAKAQAVEGRKLLLGTMRERFGDELLAESAARAAATEYARKVAERETASFKGPEAEVRRKELLAGLAGQEAEAREAMRQRAAQLGMQQAEYALRVQAMQQQARQQQAGAVAEGGQPVPVASLTKEQRERAVIFPGGKVAALALDKEAAKKAREATVAFQGTDQAIQRLVQLRNEYGGEVLPSEAKAQMDSLKEEVILQMKDSLNLGVMSDSDYKLMERLIGGDASSFFSINASSTLNALRERSRERYLSTIQQYGINLGVQGFREKQPKK